MRIVFGDAFDDGAWPGPLGGTAKRAVLDEVWVGAQGLTDVLEVRLGLLAADAHTQAERAADLARKLRAASAAGASAPWTSSLSVDPLATARALLRTRDALGEIGVDDSVDDGVLPERLRAIHAATRGCLPGRVDRTRAVLTALRQGWRSRVDVVETVGDLEAQTPLTRQLLQALGDGGTSIGARVLPRASNEGSDLARARAFVDGAGAGGSGEGLRGDGSLLLLRPDDAASCADEVAEFVRARVDGGEEGARAGAASTIIVGADDGLDEALHRRGAPTLGIAGVSGNDALLALLPLVVAVAADHPDPERLYELCALPLSPVPRNIAASVRRALLKQPSARSPDVVKAIEAGLLSLLSRDQTDLGDDAAKVKNDRLRERLKVLVPAWGGLSVSPLSTSVLLDRTANLLQWLQGRQKREHGDDERTPYRAAIRQISLFRRLLLQLELESLTAPQLLRLLESATEGIRPLPRRQAEAGLVKLDGPGTLCGPADVVIWWGFTQDSARLPRSPFSVEETRQLSDAGFAPPSSSARAKAHAKAERRPLLHARQRLILCCPRRGDDGREQHPHPLWDELMARVPKDERRSAARALTRPETGQLSLVARVPPVPRALPQPITSWRIPPGSVQPSEVTSPSSEERLLSCSFRAVLQERNVKPSRLHLPRGAQLEGQVVHALIARVLQKKVTDKDEAAAVARAEFDAVAEEAAGAWLRPGREQTRLRVRERAARAAQALVQILGDNGFVTVMVEEEVEKQLPGQRTLKGTPDVVVDGPLGRMVIDHKTGNDRSRRQQLAEGSAVQLVDYTVIVGEKGKPWPQAAYFQLRSRRLITTDARVKGAEVVVGPRPKDAWDVVDKARQRVFAELIKGELSAPAADGSSPLLHVLQDPLQLEPPCPGCPADVLCGRAFVPRKR